jgi:hypothetical protein
MLAQYLAIAELASDAAPRAIELVATWVVFAATHWALSSHLAPDILCSRGLDMAGHPSLGHQYMGMWGNQPDKSRSGLPLHT